MPETTANVVSGSFRIVTTSFWSLRDSEPGALSPEAAAQLRDEDGDSLDAVRRAANFSGELASVTDWNNQTTSLGYDPDGNLTTTTYPNGIVDARSYDAADQLTSPPPAELCTHETFNVAALVLAYTT